MTPEPFDYKAYERDKMCHGKRHYKFKRQAEEVLIDMRKHGRAKDILEVYKCKYGNHYHLGNNSRKLKKRLAKEARSRRKIRALAKKGSKD